MKNYSCTAVRCLLLLVGVPIFTSSGLGAEPIRVASWNLGWHVAQAEVPNWVRQCDISYVKDPADQIWKPVPASVPGATQGWMIKESRAKLEGVDLSVMPPCGVYESPSHAKIAVTESSFAQRVRQLSNFVGTSVKPDVIAFQEVSGSTAAREALGKLATEYNVCSFDGQYKIQRLAFAWKKEFGGAVEACQVVHQLSLPALDPVEQVRPGLTVALKIHGKTIRFLTVHLKSSCVSPLDRGKLDDDKGKNNPCPILQQQIAPLESAFEKLSTGVDHFVMLGDFNRNLWHEAIEVPGAEPIRSDGSRDLTAALPASVKSRNLFKEVNDGQPPASRASLIPISCPGDETVQKLCDRSKLEALKPAVLAPLVAKEGLGCRNPVGLDHFVISDSLKPFVKGAQKIPIGALGRSLPPKEGKPEPLLAISDHCPILLNVDLS